MLKKTTIFSTLTLALVAAPVFSASAETIPGSRFGYGNWSGNAFYDDGGFTHCAISASYRSGTSLHFAIDKKYKWRIGFSNQKWRMQKGNSFGIRYQIDRHRIISTQANVISPTFVLAELVANKRIFNQFRRGNMLRVEAGGKIYPFKLTGTSRALKSVLRCVDRHINYRPPAAVSEGFGSPGNGFGSPGNGNSNGFGPSGNGSASLSFGPESTPDAVKLDAPRAKKPARSSLFSHTPEDQRAASRFVTDLFSTDEYNGYKLIQRAALAKAKGSKLVKNAAIGWKGGHASGLLHVLNLDADKSTDVVSRMIAGDAKHCQGKFASGTKRSQHDARIHLAFTACEKGGTYKFYVDYMVFPNDAGKLYLISNMQTNREQVDRSHADTFSRNIAYQIQ